MYKIKIEGYFEGKNDVVETVFLKADYVFVGEQIIELKLWDKETLDYCDFLWWWREKGTKHYLNGEDNDIEVDPIKIQVDGETIYNILD